ncbi:AI-2E family transporter [Patescibacteria group bacterium]|nr:AI-2E family transporter [Patescibacteria group bacterium]
MNEQSRVLDISWGTILKIAVAGLVIYILFLTKDIMIWVLFGLIISILFDPAIDFLQKRRIPRVLAVISVYSAVFGVLALTIWSIAPLFVNEIQRFSQLFPQYFETLSPILQGLGITAFSDVQTFFDALSFGVENIAGSIFSAFFVVFGGIFSTIFVLSISIFLSIEEKSIEKTIGLLFPKKYEEFALDLWIRSQRKVSGWFTSRMITSIFVGVATSLTLFLFNVQYPFSLGLLATILNFIPIIGPLVTGLLLFIVVALDSTLKAIFILLAFTLIQQIEGNILTPLLTKRFLGIPPALVLIALAVGMQLWGIMGAILAIPLAGIIFEFLRDFLRKRKEEDAKTV